MSNNKKFIVELGLDGYEDQESHDEACEEFIYEQLDMTASSVTITPFDDLQAKYDSLKEMNEKLEQDLQQYRDAENRCEDE